MGLQGLCEQDTLTEQRPGNTPQVLPSHGDMRLILTGLKPTHRGEGPLHVLVQEAGAPLDTGAPPSAAGERWRLEVCRSRASLGRRGSANITLSSLS